VTEPETDEMLWAVIRTTMVVSHSKMEEDAEFCEQLADAVGLGFHLPDTKPITNLDVAPIAPKTQLETSIA
jgi:hypothetical protein